MNDKTITGNDTTLLAVNELQLSVAGKILTPGNDEYDAERKIWNSMIDRRPRFIVQAAGAADVVAAVNYARKNNLKVSVRGGGHNVAGNSICDDGMMIDLSKMKTIHVDPVNKIAKAEPGVILRELDAATQQYNLATTIGTFQKRELPALL